jgi:thiamine biosynthesis protein ThiS
MTITVNGEAREVGEGITVRALLTDSKLTPEKVAVELNRRLLRTEKYDTPLQAGDAVEIVTFVGGGA